MDDLSCNNCKSQRWLGVGVGVCNIFINEDGFERLQGDDKNLNRCQQCLDLERDLSTVNGFNLGKELREEYIKKSTLNLTRDGGE